jgi:hypothetical protein
LGCVDSCWLSSVFDPLFCAVSLIANAQKVFQATNTHKGV